MGCVNPGIFWGILLVLIGISIIVKYVFNIHFPIFKTLIAFFFIYLGLKMLFGNFCCSGSMRGNHAVFSETKFSYSDKQDEYSVVFGKSYLDLSNIEIKENRKIEVSSVFGDCTVKINKTSNVEILANTAFGNFSTPENDRNAFGKFNYQAKNFNSSMPHLTVKANVVFGNMKIISD